MVIKSKKDFCKIETIEEIKNTPPNTTLFFRYDLELIKYCYDNDLSFAVAVDSIKEAIFANHFGAAYIVVKKDMAKKIQNVANEYLFDAKILVKIVFDWEIEIFAQKGIDGVYLRDNLSF
ncbi:hypothetical protein [Nitrosophilus labii]|uniref:hypothetical protein n=1 Tax=Nitrosophilus labii TaxID=2706014 RepID=UPI0016571D2C|nr:hypothetical protein [Nitrosophilus labii]